MTRYSNRHDTTGSYGFINQDANTVAWGMSNAATIFAISVPLPGVVATMATNQQFTISNQANGNITLSPNGTGATEVTNGNLEVLAGDIDLNSADAGGAQMTTSLGTVQIMRIRTTTNNTFLGRSAGSAGAISSGNTGIGAFSCDALIENGFHNSCLGFETLTNGTTASFNVAAGSFSLNSAVTSALSTAIGYRSLSNATGGEHVAVGADSGINLVGGTRNIYLGYTAGFNHTGAESNDIYIGSQGVTTENNTIRIGTQGGGVGQQNSCFVAGIFGVNVSGSEVVVCNSGGRLGTTTGGTLFSSTYNTDAGAAVPAAGAITIAGGTNIGTTGAGSTVTVNLDSSITLAGSVSAGTTLSAGTTVTAGTGITATTGNITASSGNVVVSAGSIDVSAAGGGGMAMTTAAGTINIIRIRTGTDNTFVGENSGVSASSSGNTCMGSQACAALEGGANQNTAIGKDALAVATSCDDHVAVGHSALRSITTNSQCTAVGKDSLELATGGTNSAFGFGSGLLLTSGTGNLLIGHNAATAYTSTESDNICINNVGVIGESNIMRIGTTGAGAKQVNKAFIAGIYNITPDNGNDGAVIIDSTGQFGSQANLVYPTNSAFFAILGAVDSNRTGTGTGFTIGSGTAFTEIYDQGGNFVTTGTFTAPVTARYSLAAGVAIEGYTALATINQTQINTSNRVHVGFRETPNTSSTRQVSAFNIYADMEAGDTATCSVAVSGEAADTVDIFGAVTNSWTFFSGICLS